MADDFTIAAKDDAALDALAELLARKLRTSVVAEVAPEIRSLFAYPCTFVQPVSGMANPSMDMQVRFDITQTELRASLILYGQYVVASVTFVFTGGLDPQLRRALREGR